MLESISFYPIFGKPLIMYGGILALVCILATFAIPHLGIKDNMKWHKRMAVISIILGLGHGLLGILSFF